MKKIRRISPFISPLLIVLVISGSFGFTLIHHTCFHCGTDETYAAVSGDDTGLICHSHSSEDLKQPLFSASEAEPGGCCSNRAEDIYHCHVRTEPAVTDDCCSHEAERVVTDELLRTEVQNEIIPYFLAATVVAVMEEVTDTNKPNFTGYRQFHCGRDLTTLFCRLQS